MRRDTYQLALIPTKYRIGEEPDPFIYQISLKDDAPWQFEDITEAVIHAGDKAKEESRQAKEVLHANAISSLKAAIPTKEYKGRCRRLPYEALQDRAAKD